MKILIVENEIYLAQSIAAKLTEIGYICEVAATIKDAIKDDFFDIVLLSTNINGQDFYPIIRHYKNAIIILLVSYISSDTVSNPLKAGAKDYILKPFMMEELVRKIDHFKEHERLKKQNETFSKYINYILGSVANTHIQIADPLPLLVKTNYQKQADAFAFAFLKTQKKPFTFVTLTDPASIETIKNSCKNELLYITDFQVLKKGEKKNLLEIIKDKSAIISSTDSTESVPFATITLPSNTAMLDHSELLSIDDYIKYVIITYQNRYPDTELSKKLGISRKSLWEKRKKYAITKKK